MLRLRNGQILVPPGVRPSPAIRRPEDRRCRSIGTGGHRGDYRCDEGQDLGGSGSPDEKSPRRMRRRCKMLNQSSI